MFKQLESLPKINHVFWSANLPAEVTDPEFERSIKDMVTVHTAVAAGDEPDTVGVILREARGVPTDKVGAETLPGMAFLFRLARDLGGAALINFNDVPVADAAAPYRFVTMKTGPGVALISDRTYAFEPTMTSTPVYGVELTNFRLQRPLLTTAIALGSSAVRQLYDQVDINFADHYARLRKMEITLAAGTSEDE
jgi:hypothetical protein